MSDCEQNRRSRLSKSAAAVGAERRQVQLLTAVCVSIRLTFSQCGFFQKTLVSNCRDSKRAYSLQDSRISSRINSYHLWESLPVRGSKSPDPMVRPLGHQAHILRTHCITFPSQRVRISEKADTENFTPSELSSEQHFWIPEKHLKLSIRMPEVIHVR